MTQVGTHDPTALATGDPAQPAALASLSCNEIESLCLKASRGAGMSWGLAEEAGFAAGWLAVRGIDAAEAVLALLRNSEQRGIAVRDRHWTAAGDAALCPIQLGATLDDHAALEAGPWFGPITIGAVRQPILLVPFLARAAKSCAKPLVLIWPGGALVILASGEVDPAVMTALSRVAVTSLTLSPAFDAAPCIAWGRKMAAFSTATLDSLNIFALRTTVPASDTSRRGAGAASSDND